MPTKNQKLPGQGLSSRTVLHAKRGNDRFGISHWAGTARGLIETQLLMSLASMPFLLAWQLPFTPLSIVGNLIHPPFLITFLGLSLILCIATLLGLPTTLLATALNSVHALWSYLLNWQPLVWWPRLTWGHFALFCILFACYHAWPYHKKSAAALAALFSAYMLFPLLLTPSAGCTHLTRNQYWLSCTPQPDGSLVLYDHGYISRTANTDALMDYEIIPHLVSHYGLPRTIQLRAKKWGKRLQKANSILHQYSSYCCLSPLIKINKRENSSIFSLMKTLLKNGLARSAVTSAFHLLFYSEDHE